MTSRSPQPVVPVKELTLTPVLTLNGHKDFTRSISYFPDGKQIISGSDDKTTRRWDLEAGEEIVELRDVSKQEVRAVGVSRDGRWAVCARHDYNDGELKVYEVETETVRRFEESNSPIDCIDISWDSTLLAGGLHASSYKVQIWSLETGKPVAVPFNIPHKASAVRFSQDSKKLAVQSNMGRHLAVWDVQLQKLDVCTRKPANCYAAYAPVFWTTNDKTIVTAFSFTDTMIKTIYEFDASTLKTIGAPFEGHTETITGLALSFDCALLASASCDNTIKLWAFESRRILASFNVRSTACRLILSPDSRQLVYTTQLNNNIYLCNTPPEIIASIQPVPQVRVRS
ncbi:WD40-repeat-containing domain protein [Suillus discolor]|uniref:WD40-repeat-containing domain protein n=1 Tax=Suillus discolor TaxID=1912936 RepID=A0A9P7FGC8_9AGAM|nr:WD40-repeat-containing domain protein [Suillus discolor]KAG2115778.1 WD40-repeat-containing domain protein [Suillus discolor]